MIAMTATSVVIDSFSWLRHCSEENGEFLISILSISDQTKGGYCRTSEDSISVVVSDSGPCPCAWGG